MTSYSSSVNGENQTKLKDTSWVRFGEDIRLGEATIRLDEEEAD